MLLHTNTKARFSRPDTSQRQRRRLPPCPLVLALVPLKCSSTNLQFHFRVPFTEKKMPWCPCPSKNEAYSPGFSDGLTLTTRAKFHGSAYRKNRIACESVSTGKWGIWGLKIKFVENYFFLENYVTSEGAVSHNVLYYMYQQLSVARYRVRFYAIIIVLSNYQ